MCYNTSTLNLKSKSFSDSCALRYFGIMSIQGRIYALKCKSHTYSNSQYPRPWDPGMLPVIFLLIE